MEGSVKPGDLGGETETGSTSRTITMYAHSLLSKKMIQIAVPSKGKTTKYSYIRQVVMTQLQPTISWNTTDNLPITIHPTSSDAKKIPKKLSSLKTLQMEALAEGKMTTKTKIFSQTVTTRTICTNFPNYKQKLK